MGAGDGVLAWRVLRHVGDYGDAWRRHGAAGPARALEPGPFRIHVQAEADLEAARFEMLAWEDPFAADGPASPFWRQDGMIEGFPWKDGREVRKYARRASRKSMLDVLDEHYFRQPLSDMDEAT